MAERRPCRRIQCSSREENCAQQGAKIDNPPVSGWRADATTVLARQRSASATPVGAASTAAASATSASLRRLLSSAASSAKCAQRPPKVVRSHRELRDASYETAGSGGRSHAGSHANGVSSLPRAALAMEGSGGNQAGEFRHREQVLRSTSTRARVEEKTGRQDQCRKRAVTHGQQEYAASGAAHECAPF